MPQLTLVLLNTDYDLYERTVAYSKGVTTDQSTAAKTSNLPRSCGFRNISYPNIAPNNTSGNPLILKDANASEIARIDPGQNYTVNSNLNNIPIIGILVNAPVNGALVDLELEIR